MRFLFTALAIVSVVLAFALSTWLLGALAAALVGVAAALHITEMRKQHRQSRRSYISSEAEDLRSVGILDIRPVEAVPADAVAQSDVVASEVLPEVEPEPVEAIAEVSPVLATEVPTTPEVIDVTVALTEPDEAWTRSRGDGEVVMPEALSALGYSHDITSMASEQTSLFDTTLQALRAAIGAHTVCLLRQDDFMYDYVIESIAGPVGQTLSAGQEFSVSGPLLTPRRMRTPVTIMNVEGEHGLTPERLGYYTETPAGVHQVAVAPVEQPDELKAYLLLADVTADATLDVLRKTELLKQFAQLFKLYLDESGAKRKVDVTGVERPRREIIADAMGEARSEGHPLALALVYLNSAEDLAGFGDDVVERAEREMKAVLNEVTDYGRVDRFGVLTYGVLYQGDVTDVEAWSDRVEQAFAIDDSYLSGGVTIGAAILCEEHDGPEDLREDAKYAMQEAYQRGAFTIVAA
ncbi:MAG: hypothetical protein AAGJ10_19200 [Bacteroidota bacterium]